MKLLLILLFYVSILGWAWGDSLASKNSEGNKLYREGKIDEALSKWRDAQIENPDNDKLHYNIGNGLHGQKRYEDAFKEYDKSLNSKNSELQQKAYYNMGNTHYRMGKLQEAIKDYEKCLEINPKDEDAKYNIEFIKKKLEEKQKKEDEKQEESQQSENKDEEQQKQNQSFQDQEKEQKEVEKQSEAQGSKEGEENQEKESHAKEEDQQSGQEEKKEDGSKEEKEKSGDENAEEKPSGEEKEGEMSKEDAVRLLDSMKDDEKDIQKELRNQPVEGRYRVDKDW